MWVGTIGRNPGMYEPASLSFMLGTLKIKQAAFPHMAKDLRSDNINSGQGYKENKTPMHCWWDYKLVQTLFIEIWQHLVKLKVFLPYIPAILLLRICPTEGLVHCTEARPRMFTAAMFVMKNNWGKKLNVQGRIEK